MKKLLASIALMATFSMAQAASIQTLLASGEAGVSAIVQQLKGPLALQGLSEQQVYLTVKNSLTGLHAGALPTSVKGLNPLLAQNFKGILDQDISKVDPHKLYGMFNESADIVSKKGIVDGYAYYSCSACNAKAADGEGLVVLSKVKLSGAGASFIQNKNYAGGIKSLGAKLGLTPREADEIVKGLPVAEDQSTALAAFGLMIEGSEDQRAFGSFLKSLPDSVQNILVVDLRVLPEVLNEARGTTLNSFRDIFSTVVTRAQTKAKNLAISEEEFKAEFKLYAAEKNLKKSDFGPCWQLSKLME